MSIGRSVAIGICAPFTDGLSVVRHVGGASIGGAATAAAAVGDAAAGATVNSTAASAGAAAIGGVVAAAATVAGQCDENINDAGDNDCRASAV